jgi:NAD(P)-dependent dehydrogenase (short-subunit alcohol dehydrogenase family)
LKTIVINGATGDLGSIVVPRLEREYRCVPLRRHETLALSSPVYGAVLLAGGFAMGGSPADFERMIETNLMSAVRAIDAVLPHLESPGRIIAMSSAASLAKPPNLSAYSASKTALNAYVETLAKELKDRSVTVNALLPTALDSKGATPTGSERLVKRENVAEMIALLLSEQAAAVTGQLIAMSA